jgi:hypothetical protein
VDPRFSTSQTLLVPVSSRIASKRPSGDGRQPDLWIDAAIQDRDTAVELNIKQGGFTCRVRRYNETALSIRGPVDRTKSRPPVYKKLTRQFTHIVTGPHPLDCHSLKLP